MNHEVAVSVLHPQLAQRGLSHLQPPLGMLAALAGACDDMGNSSIMPTMKHAPTATTSTSAGARNQAASDERGQRGGRFCLSGIHLKAKLDMACTPVCGLTWLPP